jgi:hypothetical protein
MDHSILHEQYYCAVNTTCSRYYWWNAGKYVNSLQSIINVYLIIRQNASVIRQVKWEIQTSNALLCKHGSTHPYCHVYLICGSDTLLNLQCKSIFRLCYHEKGSCRVDIREISECYILRLAQDLKFIFRVPIRNTIIENGQD